VERLRRYDGALGDVGILSLTSYGVKDARRLLESAGIPSIDLAEYVGTPVDAIKVGTIKRAKGLEFKAVLLPRVRADLIDPSERDDEAHVIRRRELYVGMTRARDELWVGVCS
jgi:superfamily I DNA/RNA helicase